MLDILHVSSPESFNDLLDIFGSESTLKRIFQIVLRQDCKTILIENDYIDSEYSSEYNEFYNKLPESVA